MLVENQLVEVKWDSKNREYYENKGYTYTKQKDVFFVKAEDAHPNSRATKIRVRCDYCGRERLLATQDYYKNTKFETIKYSCGSKGCASQKHEEYDYERKREQIQKFYDLCKEKGYKPISTINDYTTSLYGKLEYECPIHGLQTITLNNLQHGNGCVYCGIELRAEKRRMSYKDVKNRIESCNNNKLLNAEDYINNSTNMQIPVERYVSSNIIGMSILI